MSRDMTDRPSWLITVIALLVGAGLSACSSSAPSAKGGGGAAAAHVLLVCTYQGHAGTYPTIQAAVAAAKPGDWVLIAPGDYHERYDRSVSVGEATTSGVWVATPGVHVRGMDRNGVVIDGTKPGAPRCSARAADQDFGPVDAKGKPVGRNGLDVWNASGGSMENMTV